MMNGLHTDLKGSRGAVAAFCCIHRQKQVVDYVGIGNITVRILGKNEIHMVPKDGIIGYMMTNASMKQVPFTRDDVLIMYTDGLKEHFSLGTCGELLSKSSQQIAESLHERYSKSSDDASCAVVKF